MLVPFTSINFSNVKAQEYSSYYDSKFSKNPTDDYKYECQKGPFEGFFVSSVEFCDIQMKEKPESPPVPPQTSSLTVYKEVFGCDNIDRGVMDCDDLDNNSQEWINCNPPSSISGSFFCTSLPENLFDIEVIDDQNNQIEQFEGSAEGETIENLEPNTYTVNEIVHTLSSVNNRLEVNTDVEAACMDNGFAGGGQLFRSQGDDKRVTYNICFEYEDEQGNDCRTITLAAEEERTCTVKNYIRAAL